MFDLQHNVRVFVFQVLPGEVQFLLLRQKPVQEWPFGPLVGSVDPAEHLHDTILREVRESTGLALPHHILELGSEPRKELFGDLGIVDWAFAYQAGTPSNPAAGLQPGPQVGEISWMGFEEAFHRIEEPGDRASLVRLQLELRG